MFEFQQPHGRYPVFKNSNSLCAATKLKFFLFMLRRKYLPPGAELLYIVPRHLLSSAPLRSHRDGGFGARHTQISSRRLPDILVNENERLFVSRRLQYDTCNPYSYVADLAERHTVSLTLCTTPSPTPPNPRACPHVAA